MKILLINNYFYIVGGAEVYFFNLAELLRQKSHKVIFFSMRSPKNFQSEQDKYFISYFPPLQDLTFFKKVKALTSVFYSFEARDKIRELIKAEKPDIVHIHNIWYEITHSIIHEIKKFNIPIVMTLNDYRLICPNHKLLVKNKLCFSCDHERYFMPVLKNCLGNSLLKNCVSMIAQYLNNCILQSYKSIDLLISPSIFLKNLFQENTLFEKRRIEYLPYCIDKDEYQPQFNAKERSIVYFGRLDFEKGIEVLIDAVKGLDVILKVIGGGPKEYFLRQKVLQGNISNVQFLGFIPHEKIKEEVSKSLFSVLPSLWYENYPYSVIESFMLGKPVVGSHIGGIPELIKDYERGLTFKPGNSKDLNQKLRDLLSNQEMICTMGKNARCWAEQNFNFSHHYESLIKLYNSVLNR